MPQTYKSGSIFDFNGSLRGENLLVNSIKQLFKSGQPSVETESGVSTESSIRSI